MAISNIKIPFGKSVKALRDQLGLSQEKLAERAGLHRTYISDVERGARNVSLESIGKLARALEVPIATLFGSPSESTPQAVPVKYISPDEMVDILLVEDHPNDVMLTMEALQAANITNGIHVVRDGAAALDFLFCTGEYAHRRQQDQPQVVLLDLNLPKMDGLEVLRRIKADPRTSFISVVMLTGSKSERDIQASKRLGADTYIVKPVDFQSLSLVTPELSLRWALLKPKPGLQL